MNKNHIAPRGALFVIIAYAGLMGKVSQRFPSVCIDEVFSSVNGHNFLAGQGPRYSLYDDIFDRSVYFMRDALPDITRTFYNTWVGLWLKASSRSYRHARWSSIAGGILCLWVMYGIGCRLKNPTLGLVLLLLTAMNPIFLYASCIVRPEIVLMLGTAFTMWMVLVMPSSWPWKPYVVGACCGLLTGIHWNALAVFVGMAVLYAAMLESGSPIRRLIFLAAGFLSGALVAFCTVNPEKFLLSLKTVNYLISTPPPILAGPRALVAGIVSTIDTFLTGKTSYSHSEVVRGWRVCMAVTWLGLGLSLLGEGLMVLRKSKADHERKRVAALSLGFAATLGAMFLLVKRQELTYVLILFPFLFPIAGFFFTSLAKRWCSPLQALRLLSLITLFSGVLLFFSFCRRYVVLAKPFDRIMEEIHHLAPDPLAKVAGPNLLWFGWPPEQVRDLGAVITSAWYTNGQKNIRGCLEEWRPETLVVDRPFARAIWGQELPLAGLKRSLGVPVQWLGTVQTGEAAYQDWEIYHIDWKSPHSPS